MAKIFISYRREDAGYLIYSIRDRLTSALPTASVFIDIDSIPLGVDYRTHLNEAIDSCDLFLAVISDNWLGEEPRGSRRIDAPNDPVRLEIESALRRGIPVIPVLAGHAELPAEGALPQSLRPLVYRNATEVRAGPHLNAHLDRLVAGIEEILGEGELEDRLRTIEREHATLERRFRGWLRRFGQN